jgi:hypothetical protein
MGNKMKKKLTKRRLTTKPKQSTIRQTMREMILSEMARRSWTAYRLAKELDGELNPQSVYDFVAGRSDLKVSSVEMILAKLDLHLTHVEPHVEAVQKKS